ncbi:protein F37C4.5-like isoform X2 [Watersipora subatra]|uniref:protein F37C4.5-like isoform X2 n=1 Tax=Watersipora subatra TaxID=2589382 RepID=UPI00355BF9B8
MVDTMEVAHKYDVKDLDILTVKVYKDRAEVTRSIKVSVSKGQAEILVEKLSSYCDLDSIRVEGKGNASITEVTSVEKLEEAPKMDESEVKSLQEQLADHKKQIRALEAEQERIKKRKEVVLGLGTQVTTPATTKEQVAPVNLFSDASLDGARKFMDFYEKQLRHCDDEAFRIDAELQEHSAKCILLEKECQESSAPVNENVRINRQVSVLLDVREEGEISLALSYLVTEAAWKPQYDIRAFSADNLVKVTYFGLITQKTGEDWNNAKIFLSTAQPSVGGDMPVLPSQTVHFKEVVLFRCRKSVGLRSFRSRGMAKSVCNSASVAEDGYVSRLQEMDVQTSEVQSGTLSTTFEVTRPSTIPSDNTEHKVTVALIDLKAAFEHFSAPKMVANAYLKAKLVNVSPYLILSGPCNIFMDNSFIAKSTLPAVSPSEKFECSLGVDFAVRVTYKPCEKMEATAGMLSKSKINEYKQVIEVKNTHQHDVTLHLEEQVPRSTNQKIKVNLVDPILPKDKDNKEGAPISMNSSGNIVWVSPITAGATKLFLLHYTIESPHDMTIDFTN